VQSGTTLSVIQSILPTESIMYSLRFGILTAVVIKIISSDVTVLPTFRRNILPLSSGYTADLKCKSCHFSEISGSHGRGY
jgi:hypothetical protein